MTHMAACLTLKLTQQGPSSMYPSSQNPSSLASLASGIGAHFCVLVSAGVPYAPLLILLYFQ